LNITKQSSIIGIGRNELPSSGVADALDKSLYKQCIHDNTRIKLEPTRKRMPVGAKDNGKE